MNDKSFANYFLFKGLLTLVVMFWVEPEHVMPLGIMSIVCVTVWAVSSVSAMSKE
jgi:hypothetical protein